MTPVRSGVRDAETLIPLYHRFSAAHLGHQLNWATYQGLFHGPEEVRRLIDVSGATFFATVEQAYLQSILLGLCRMTDPVQSGPNENLTLGRLIEYFEYEQVRSALALSLDEATKACAFARTYRNKVIAHQDFVVGQPGGSHHLPGLTVELVDAALAAVDRFLSQVEESFSGWQRLRVGGLSIGGHDVLLRRLWEAEQWRREHPGTAEMG